MNWNQASKVQIDYLKSIHKMPTAFLREDYYLNMAKEQEIQDMNQNG